jgi:hypothetical protein
MVGFFNVISFRRKSMDKLDIFNEYCRVIEEDGTKDELLVFYAFHSQQDKEILKRACEKISDYVSFCMESSDSYWCENKKKYIPDYLADKDNTIDKTKWKIRIWGESMDIFPETKLEEGSYMDEMIKIHLMGLSYQRLFNKLLSNEI